MSGRGYYQGREYYETGTLKKDEHGRIYYPNGTFYFDGSTYYNPNGTIKK